MSDTRHEWISKRAYTIWEEAGRPDGLDGDHWLQAVSERAEFEKVTLAGYETKARAEKPLIEISGKTKAASPATKRTKKKAADPAPKARAAKPDGEAKPT